MGEVKRLKIDVEVNDKSLLESTHALTQAIISYSLEKKDPSFAFKMPAGMLAAAYGIYATMGETNEKRKELLELTLKLVRGDMERAGQLSAALNDFVGDIIKKAEEINPCEDRN